MIQTYILASELYRNRVLFILLDVIVDCVNVNVFRVSMYDDVRNSDVMYNTFCLQVCTCERVCVVWQYACECISLTVRFKYMTFSYME